jgi:hypothetical protein
MAVDLSALIESAVVRGNQNDHRELLEAIVNQLSAIGGAVGVSPLTPTSSVQKSATTPPPAATATATGANGITTIQVTNPTLATNSTIYHEISYSPVKNFSQNVTTLPPTAQTQITIPNPGQSPFIRIRSSFNKNDWNSHQLIQNTAVDAGLQSSAASEPATVLNNWNYANVVGGGVGGTSTIQVYGPNGPYSGYTAGRGSTQVSRPSATILNTSYKQNQIVAFDGKQFQVASILPGALKDSWEPVGQAGTQAAPGGGGNMGGNGCRLTAI